MSETELRDTTEWLKAGGYLPEFLRDFHDQKDVFKAIDEVVQRRGDDYTKDLSWVAAQVYVIEVFLWMMARHGYTLQKSRVRADFSDLDEWVRSAKSRRDTQMAAMMGLTPASPPTT